MTKFFDAFGKLGRNLENTTLIAGRRLFLSNLEITIAEDIERKLDLRSNDTLLEIGCGPGNLLFHLVDKVKSIVGIDHPDILPHTAKKLEAFHNVELYGGDWFDIMIDRTFDKILIYSVIQYLGNYDNLVIFLDKAVNSLNDGGKILIGDIPNKSKMERFRHSQIFNLVEKEYREKNRKFKEKETSVMEDVFNEVKQGSFNIDDDLILKLVALYRLKGLDVYILPQNSGLPYGYSREDILLCQGHIL